MRGRLYIVTSSKSQVKNLYISAILRPADPARILVSSGFFAHTLLQALNPVVVVFSSDYNIIVCLIHRDKSPLIH